MSLSSASVNVNLARLPLSASNMATSRLEINFIRLLSRCESLASEKRNETEWRLEKVIHNNTAFACTSVLLKQILYFLLDTTKQYLPSPFLYELTYVSKTKHAFIFMPNVLELISCLVCFLSSLWIFVHFSI